MAAVPFGGGPSSGQGVVGTLVPNADKTNAGSWTNEVANTCFDSASCYQSLDEGIASANDADFISSVTDPMNRIVEFELEDAPADLDTLTDITVRFRAFRQGTAEVNVLVEVSVRRRLLSRRRRLRR